MQKGFKFQRLQILIHVLAWTILFCFPFIGRDSVHPAFLYKSIFNLTLLVLFFYVNMFVLIPKFLLAKKIGIYIGIVIMIISQIVFTNIAYDMWTMDAPFNEISAEGPPMMHRKHRSFFRIMPTLLSSLLFFGISTSLTVINEYLKKESQQKEIDNEKLNSELAFLKSQINPHFLFNTLNNLYSLANSGSTKTDQAILKLSELMRYMIEDTRGRKVELYKEIEYIKNYLELQKLRIQDSVEMQLTVTGTIENKYIEPLLLIPFIENAIKHGISYNEPSYIRILISIEEKKLFLRVENSIAALKTEKDEQSGIGLKNVTKRLTLLYPEKHELVIEDTKTNYLVKLSIDL